MANGCVKGSIHVNKMVYLALVISLVFLSVLAVSFLSDGTIGTFTSAVVAGP